MHFISFLLRKLLQSAFSKFWPLADSFVFKNIVMALVSPMDLKCFVTCGRRSFLSSVHMYYHYFPKEELLKKVFRLHFFQNSVADRTAAAT